MPDGVIRLAALRRQAPSRPIVTRTAADRPGIVILVPGSDVGLPPVVIAIAVVGGITVPAIRGVSVPLVVARVVVARIKIEHAALSGCC